jgi:hypothetical protein
MELIDKPELVIRSKYIYKHFLKNTQHPPSHHSTLYPKASASAGASLYLLQRLHSSVRNYTPQLPRFLHITSSISACSCSRKSTHRARIAILKLLRLHRVWRTSPRNTQSYRQALKFQKKWDISHPKRKRLSLSTSRRQSIWFFKRSFE